jgi:hypothetical protein
MQQRTMLDAVRTFLARVTLLVDDAQIPMNQQLVPDVTVCFLCNAEQTIIRNPSGNPQ